MAEIRQPKSSTSTLHPVAPWGTSQRSKGEHCWLGRKSLKVSISKNSPPWHPPKSPSSKSRTHQPEQHQNSSSRVFRLQEEWARSTRSSKRSHRENQWKTSGLTNLSRVCASYQTMFQEWKVAPVRVLFKSSYSKDTLEQAYGVQKLWSVNTNIKTVSLCISGLKSGIFSCAEFTSQKACEKCWLLRCKNCPLRSLELQASEMPSKSITLSTAGLAGLWALKLVQNPRWPLGYTSPHILLLPSLRQPRHFVISNPEAHFCSKWAPWIFQNNSHLPQGNRKE